MLLSRNLPTDVHKHIGSLLAISTALGLGNVSTRSVSVIVCGEQSHCKSTAVNCLLGKEISPMGSDTTTKAPILFVISPSKGHGIVIKARGSANSCTGPAEAKSVLDSIFANMPVTYSDEDTIEIHLSSPSTSESMVIKEMPGPKTGMAPLMEAVFPPGDSEEENVVIVVVRGDKTEGDVSSASFVNSLFSEARRRKDTVPRLHLVVAITAMDNVIRNKQHLTKLVGIGMDDLMRSTRENGLKVDVCLIQTRDFCPDGSSLPMTPQRLKETTEEMARVPEIAHLLARMPEVRLGVPAMTELVLSKKMAILTRDKQKRDSLKEMIASLRPHLACREEASRQTTHLSVAASKIMSAVNSPNGPIVDMQTRVGSALALKMREILSDPEIMQRCESAATAALREERNSSSSAQMLEGHLEGKLADQQVKMIHDLLAKLTEKSGDISLIVKDAVRSVINECCGSMYQEHGIVHKHLSAFNAEFERGTFPSVTETVKETIRLQRLFPSRKPLPVELLAKGWPKSWSFFHEGLAGRKRKMEDTDAPSQSDIDRMLLPSWSRLVMCVNHIETELVIRSTEMCLQYAIKLVESMSTNAPNISKEREEELEKYRSAGESCDAVEAALEALDEVDTKQATPVKKSVWGALSGLWTGQ